MKHLLLAFGIMGAVYCADKSKTISSKAPQSDSTTTCIKVALNISMNDYKDVTAKRIVKDSTREETVETTEGGQIIKQLKPYRDTVYFAWWPVPIPDSTGKKARLNHLGQDSVIYRFVPVQKDMVVFDYNRNFK